MRRIFPFVILGCAFLLLCFIYEKKIDCWIDSDTASDLVMARQLASEGRLLSKNWYYSSELHVIKTQLVTMPLFLLTDSFHTVRVVSAWIWFAILILSYLYFCQQIGLSKPLWAFGVLLLLPFSKTYFQYVLMGCYYIPYIAVSFIAVGLLFQAGRYRGIKWLLLLGVGGLLALFSGLGGPRQLAMIYLPLFLAGLIQAIPAWKTHTGTRMSFLNVAAFRRGAASLFYFLSCFLGYIVNTKFLSKIYPFETWKSLKFQSFSLEGLETLLTGFLDTLGYTEGKVFSGALLCNLSCFALCLLALIAIIHCIKHRREVCEGQLYLTVFFLCGLAIYSGLGLFTDAGNASRYNISILVFIIPLLAANLGALFNRPAAQRFALIGVALLVTAAGLINLESIYRTDKTKPLREVGAYLTERGYTAGYATYWKGNVLTELTNGQVAVWAWCDSTHPEEFSQMESVDAINPWLQLTSHAEQHPDGPVFILLSQREWKSFPWKDQLTEENAVFQSSNKNYTVYGFSSYEALCDCLYAGSGS